MRMNYGECEFFFFVVNYRDMPRGRIGQYSYKKKNKPFESKIETFSSSRK